MDRGCRSNTDPPIATHHDGDSGYISVSCLIGMLPSFHTNSKSARAAFLGDRYGIGLWLQFSMQTDRCRLASLGSRMRRTAVTTLSISCSNRPLPFRRVRCMHRAVGHSQLDVLRQICPHDNPRWIYAPLGEQPIFVRSSRSQLVERLG